MRVEDAHHIGIIITDDHQRCQVFGLARTWRLGTESRGNLFIARGSKRFIGFLEQVFEPSSPSAWRRGDARKYPRNIVRTALLHNRRQAVSRRGGAYLGQ